MAQNSLLMSVAVSRYARVLFEVAKACNELFTVEKILQSFSESFAKSADFKNFVNNPKITPDIQRNFFKSILAVNDNPNNIAEKIVLNYFELLIAQHRLNLFIDIFAKFKQMAARYNNIVTVTVTTAVALSDEEREEIVNIFTESEGKKIALDEQINPKILGGVIINIGSRQINTSLSYKLNSIKQALKEVG
ncbi:ATP synthase F1 subunit delta [Bartonella sp. DGB1]|uniref:ATP synthase F1 subunit delta n=1 Tax=Bartonella sp. DGB1 TaxID=3239807 RepID=UPI00352692C3